MAKRKNKEESYTEMDVDPIVLDDEYDIRTDEESQDEDPRLVEWTIGGEENAKKLLCDLYSGLTSAYGQYHRDYENPVFAFVVRIIPYIFLAGVYAICIASIVLGTFSAMIGIITAIVTVAMPCISFLFRKEKITVLWWKEKGRTVSVYKFLSGRNKGDIVIYVNKKYSWRFNYKEGQWMKNDIDLMGSRLLFSKLNGELRTKELKSGETEIGAYKRSRAQASFVKKKSEQAKIVLKNGVPVYIENWEEHIGSKHHWVNNRFYFQEINGDRQEKIPESFLKFCEENCIQPLKENERLCYCDDRSVEVPHISNCEGQDTQGRGNAEELIQETAVIWKSKPFRAAFVLGSFCHLLPIAVCFGGFAGILTYALIKDGTFSIPMTAYSILIAVLLFVFLTPVYVWIFQIVTADLRYKKTEYILAKNGIVIKKWKLGGRAEVVKYSDVECVNYKIGFVDKPFGTGDVLLSCKGRKLIFKNQKNPSSTANELKRIIKERKSHIKE